MGLFAEEEEVGDLFFFLFGETGSSLDVVCLCIETCVSVVR